MKGTLREDIRNPNFSSIWIELGLGKQTILVGCLYREHQYMKETENLSLSNEQQAFRWNIFVQQWKAALNTGWEVHTLGDFNIDSKAFASPVGKQGEFIKMVTDGILTVGVSQWYKVQQDGHRGCKQGYLKRLTIIGQWLPKNCQIYRFSDGFKWPCSFISSAACNIKKEQSTIWDQKELQEL